MVQISFTSFLKLFGNQILSKVTSESIQNYLLNQTWTSSYRNLIKSTLALFFKYALKVGYIDSNPMERVVLPKTKLSFEDIDKKRQKYLTHEQMILFLKDLYENGHNHTFNVLVEFLYLTGLRFGEAQTLMWSNVDFENGVIHIRHTVEHSGKKSNYKITEPKTMNAYRAVSLGSRAIELLKQLKQISSGNKNLVFTDKHGNFIVLNTFNLYVKRYFNNKTLGKDESFKLSSHVFRHSHVSLLTELGFHIKEIMERVGHGDEGTTIKIYTHISKKMKETSLDRLEKVELVLSEKLTKNIENI